MTASSLPDTASSPRRALVTGASTGLGREIALALARQGYDVALADREISLLDPVMDNPALAAVKALPLEIELRSQASIDQGFDAAVAAFGGLDVLVNNAARPLHRPAIEVTWEEWDDVIDINLKGSYFLACRLARHCIEDDRPGAVVNMTSTHGLTGLAGRSVYGTSKGALIQMTRMLAIEWAEYGVRVNAVAPTTVLTESRQQILKDPELREFMLGRIPVGKFPEAGEIASAVCYLVSPDAVSITGQTLVIDGGLTAA